ncbi:MAG: family 43 glycosylhydrolase [Bacteroidota bacterium]
MTHVLSRFFFLIFLTLLTTTSYGQRTFNNPIGGFEADPQVFFKDGFYYYTATSGNGITIRKSANLHQVATAPGVSVWQPSGDRIINTIWAPEIHYINGKWYVYASGSPCGDFTKCNQLSFVLEGTTQNPLDPFVLKEVLAEGIDGTILQKDDGTLYFVWMRTDGPITLDVCIALMESPTKLKAGSPIVRISKDPFLEWETRDQHTNEGPAILKKGNKTFIIYSGSASWTQWYCLGGFVNTDGDYMNAASWDKSPEPLFSKSDKNGVYGPGHCAFTQSPDGTEDWIIYHALADPNGGWGARTPRIQRFTWSTSGWPVFGEPAATSMSLPVPSDGSCTKQTILFAKPTNHLTTDADFSINATSDAGLPLTYTVTGPAQALSGKIHLTGIAGLVTITASQLGSATICAAWSETQQFTVIDPSVTLGTGTGLQANYFNGINFNTAQVDRVDSVINFNWYAGSPATGVNVDQFSATWKGMVQPLYAGQYKFSIISDNGRRLWIDNTLVIDKWLGDWNIEYSGTVTLEANKKYPIRIEYFEEGGGANIRLFWSSDKQSKEIVPKRQLYPDFVTSTEENLASTFSMLPNPASQKVVFKSQNALPLEQIHIWDLSGREIHAIDNLRSSQYEWDASSLSSGMYLVQVKCGSFSYVRKLVID